MNRGMPDHGTSLSQQHRRQLLRLLLAFTVVFGAIFITINFLAGKYTLMSVEAAVSGFALWLLTIVPRTPHLRRWSLIYLILLFTGTLFAFITPAAHISVFSWVMIMPIVAHLLLGRRLGGIISGFYVALAAAIFVWRFGTSEVLGSPGSIANVVTVTACSYLFSHVYEASREQAESQLSAMALTDSLTGLANRSQLEHSFERAIIQRELPLSLVMIDLDYFKRINDEHGHDTGDAVLRTVADALRAHVRQTDVACRLGGEEFCLLLPNTELADAQQMSERLREGIETLECCHRDVVLRLTASIGVAASDQAEKLDPMLHIADQNLYKAKLGGRNRVVC